MSEQRRRLKAGRKPTPTMLKPFASGSRAAVWAIMRKGATQEAGLCLTAREIERLSYTPQRTIRSYMTCLVAAGIARTLKPLRPGAGIRFQLVEGGTDVPPRIRPDGGDVTQGSGRDRMWRTMKMLKVFTALDLAVAASLPSAPVATGEAKHYVKWLAKAGYIVLARPHEHAGAGRLATYRFIRNTGPRAPMILRTRAVWDPNTNAPMFMPTPSRATEAAHAGI